jgi:excinuclease UvrABC nuclease subunit
MAQSWEDELRELRDEFHQIAVSVHRERIDRTIDEAVIERSANPDALLH